MATRQKIDYRKIKKDYLSSNVSFSELAKRYKVNKSCISRTAQKEGWEKQKLELANKATVKMAQATIEADIDAWEKTKATMLRILDKKLAELEEGICDMTYGQMAKAIKDLRDIGVFGVTAVELKTVAETKRIEKEIKEDGNKDLKVEVMMENIDDYSN